MTQKFIHLVTRSDMSFPSPAPIGDYVGSARVSDYVKLAAERGDDAIAFTELGSMRGIFEQTVQCAKHGIRPIYGCEFYVAADMTKKSVTKDQATEIAKGLPPNKWSDAIEAYAREHGYATTTSGADLTTITLWAGTSEGLKNLFHMLYLSWRPESFYNKPRIDIDLLREHATGVWCGTGGTNSYVNRPIVEGKRREAVERANQLFEIFNDRLRFEVRPQRILVQMKANKFAIEQSERLGVPVVATAAAHYISEGDHRYQKMLASIGAGARTKLDMAGLAADAYWLRTREEVIEGLASVGLSTEQALAACDETVSLASRLDVEYKLDSFAMVIPPIETDGITHNEYLRQLCEESPIWDQLWTGWRAHYDDEGAQIQKGLYRDRMESELKSLGRAVSEGNENTFASYMLYVREVMEMGREIGVTFGPGRGSAAGSIVAWLVGVTQIDPIKFGLSFERFLNPQRVGPPDIDVDCDPAMRSALFAKMRERWGADNVAQIANMGKLKGRNVVKDVCRELEVDYILSNAATSSIERRSDNDHRPYSAARDAFLGYVDEKGETHPPQPACVRIHEEDRRVLEYAEHLEGKMRVLGIHAGGVVAAPLPLWNYVPMESRNDPDGPGRVSVVAFEKVGTEEVGLLKIDMLGVKTITTVRLALEKVNAGRYELIQKMTARSWSDDPSIDPAELRHLKTEPRLTMESVPYDDPETLAAFSAGDFAGVFQYDTPTIANLCRGLQFEAFDVTADMTALGRPGPLDNGTAVKYVARLMGQESVEVDYCPEISDLLSKTYGVMVYQEQIMEIFALAGHENPDRMRKIIGKKLVSKMEAERPGFVAGMIKNTSIDEEGAERLFDDIAAFGRYSFNKSHSVAYARIGWICQYLKIHYPLEWSWALIATSPDKKRRHFAKDAVRRGINLLPPDVSISGHTLTLDRKRNAVLGSLSGIKQVGSKAAESIVAAQPFSSFDDFMSRVERRAVNAGTIVALARAGALDSLLPNPKFFVDNASQLFGQMKNKNWKPWDIRVIPDQLDTLREELAEIEAKRIMVGEDFDRIAGLEIRIAATEPPLTPWMRQHMIREDDGSYNMNRRRPVTTWADILAGSELEPQWTDSERALEAATVNPMALENPYNNLLATLVIDVHDDFAYKGDPETDDPGFIAKNHNQGLWVTGALAKVEERQNLPYGGRQASEEERDHRSYAAAFADAMLEDEAGDQVKIKIPWNVYEHCSEAANDGSPILALVVPDEQYQKLRAKLVIDLEGMRNGSIKNLWTRLVTEGHPSSSFDWPNTSHGQRAEKWATKDFGLYIDRLKRKNDKKMNLPVVGLVTDVRDKINSKGLEQADIGLLTASGHYLKLTAFNSDWVGGMGWRNKRRVKLPPLRGSIGPGSLVVMDVKANEWAGQKSLILGDSWHVFGEGKNR